jgi:hypothetical protein
MGRDRTGMESTAMKGHEREYYGTEENGKRLNAHG